MLKNNKELNVFIEKKGIENFILIGTDEVPTSCDDSLFYSFYWSNETGVFHYDDGNSEYSFQDELPEFVKKWIEKKRCDHV